MIANTYAEHELIYCIRCPIVGKPILIGEMRIHAAIREPLDKNCLGIPGGKS